MAWRIAGVHFIGRLDNAAPEQNPPHAIDKRARQERIVVRGSIGKCSATRKLRDADPGLGINVVVILVLFLLAFRRSLLLDDFASQERNDGRLGFLFEVGKIVETANRRFRNLRAAFDIFAAFVGGNQSPIVRLLDLASQRVIVALGAIDFSAVNQRRDGLGYRLSVIAAFVEKPGSTLIFWFLSASDQNGAHDFVPGTIRAEAGLEEVPPTVVSAPVFGAFAF